MTQFSTRMKARTLRGLTLIEGLLFLGIAALVIVGVVAFYNTASTSTKLNQVQTQIQAYVSGVKTLYASQDSYATVDTALIISAGKAPDNAVRGTTLRNPWAGPTVISGTTNYFEIEFQEIPQDACTGILSAGMLDNSTLIRISANGTSFTANPDPAAANSACNSATSNTITFRAR